MNFLLQHLRYILLLLAMFSAATQAEKVQINSGALVLTETVTTNTSEAENIEQLFSAAKEDIEARRLTQPDDNNALDKSHQINAIEQGHPYVEQIKQLIVDRYVGLAEESIKNKEYKRANLRLRKAATIKPADKELARVKQLLIQTTQKKNITEKEELKTSEKEVEKKVEVKQPENKTEKQIATLFAKGMTAIEKRYLTQPENASAVFYVQSIEGLQKGHPKAAELRLNIVKRFEKLAGEAIANKNYKKAAERLKKAEIIIPNRKENKALIEKIKKVRPELVASKEELAELKERERLEQERKAAEQKEKEKQKKIASLIAGALKNIQNNKLEQPKNDNAKSKLQELKKLDPENKGIKQIVQQLVNKYKENADKAFTDKQYDETLDIAEKIDQLEKGSVLESYKEKIKQQKIAVLITDAIKNIEDNKLDKPEADNAEAKLNQLKKLDADNPAIGIVSKNLVKKYIEIADIALKEKNYALVKTTASKIDALSGGNILGEYSKKIQSQIEQDELEEKIASLTKQAKANIKNKQLTSPSSNNALQKVKEIESLIAKHPSALALRKEIALEYERLVKLSVDSESFEKAQEYIVKIQSIYPDSKNIDELEKLITEKENRLITIKIQNLYKDAQRHIKASRLQGDNKNNALSKLKEIEELEPNSEFVEKLAEEIKQAYLSNIDSAIEQNNFTKAKQLLEDAEKALGYDQKIQASIEKITLAEQVFTKEQEEIRLEKERQRKITALSNDIIENIEANHLDTPEGNNAYSKLKELSSLEPSETVLKEINKRLLARHLANAKVALSKNDYMQADQEIEAALLIDANNKNTLVLQKQSIEQQAVLEQKRIAEQETLANQAKIKALVKLIEEDIKQDRLNSPKGNNALEKIIRIEDLDSENLQVISLRKQVLEKYNLLALKAINDAELEKAVYYIDSAKSLFPNESSVNELAQLLADKKQALEQEAIEQELDRQNLAKFKALNEAALNDVDVARLTKPEGDNALVKLQEMQKLFPENEKVDELKLAIVKRFEGLAEIKIQAVEYETALEYLQQVEKILPNREKTIELNKKLASAQQQKNEKIIKTLAAEAEFDINADRLLSPKGNNALDKIEKIEAIDPLHQEAVRLRLQIALKYEKLIEQSIADRDFEQADLLLKRAETVTTYLKEELNIGEKINEAREIDEEEQLEQERLSAQNKKIEALVRAAKRDIEAGRLSQPVGDNAIEKIEEIEKIDPYHDQAGLLRNRVIKKYHELAKTAMENKRFDQAQDLTLKMEGVLPGSEESKTMQAELEQEQAQLAQKEALELEVKAKREERLRQLYNGALSDIAQSRLSLPKGNNAVEKAEAIEALKADHPYAAEIKLKIVEEYESLADKALSVGLNEKARTWLDKASEMLPNRPETRLLKNRLLDEEIKEGKEIEANLAETTDEDESTNSGIPLPEMVFILSGNFKMGCVTGENCFSNEYPVKEIEINSFLMSKYEVTFEQYDYFAKETGRALPGDEGWGRGNRPVINVTYDDSKAYAEWLSEKTGKKYRLPTEAEWEYAARANTSSQYSWGNAVGEGNANCDGCGSRWDNISTAPVGSFAGNAFGLHDMHGNVWERVEDCWHEDYAGIPLDGRAWIQGGDCEIRVLRGGSWFIKPGFIRSAVRFNLHAYYSHFNIGIRLARDL